MWIVLDRLDGVNEVREIGREGLESGEELRARLLKLGRVRGGCKGANAEVGGEKRAGCSERCLDVAVSGPLVGELRGRGCGCTYDWTCRNGSPLSRFAILEQLLRDLTSVEASTDRRLFQSIKERTNRNLPRVHLARTRPAPRYQHLLANAGVYKVSEDESSD